MKNIGGSSQLNAGGALAECQAGRAFVSAYPNILSRGTLMASQNGNLKMTFI